MATGDLTTLANVKSWMSITSTDHDVVLTRLISAASNFVASWLNRDLFAADYNERFNGTGTRSLMLTNYPVLSVAAVVINGVSVPAGTDTADGYFFDKDGLALRGYSFQAGVCNVRVSYRGGFETIPLEIEQAVIELVSLRHKERERIGLVSKGLAGETITFTQKDFTMSIKSVLNQFKRVV